MREGDYPGNVRTTLAYLGTFAIYMSTHPEEAFDSIGIAPDTNMIADNVVETTSWLFLANGDHL